MFELADPDENPVSLSGLLAEGPLLLYFYPADFSPLCTKQACMVNEEHERLRGVGARVVGVSAQSPATHRKFRERQGLRFPLLSDPGKRIARAYGATAVFGLIPRRVSYDIGVDGLILDAAESNVSLEGHRRFIERAIARRQ
jgi:peroxiredoxin Q/BCP